MSLDFFNFYNFFNFEDLFTIMLLYNFIKYLIVITLNELVWPTQFFNRRHVISYNSYKFRTFTEYILKLKGYTSYTYILNLFFFNYKIIFKKQL